MCVSQRKREDLMEKGSHLLCAIEAPMTPLLKYWVLLICPAWIRPRHSNPLSASVLHYITRRLKHTAAQTHGKSNTWIWMHCWHQMRSVFIVQKSPFFGLMSHYYFHQMKRGRQNCQTHWYAHTHTCSLPWMHSLTFARAHTFIYSGLNRVTPVLPPHSAVTLLRGGRSAAARLSPPGYPDSSPWWSDPCSRRLNATAIILVVNWTINHRAGARECAWNGEGPSGVCLLSGCRARPSPLQVFIRCDVYDLRRGSPSALLAED